MKRRNFLSAVAAGAATAVLPVGVFAASPNVSYRTDPRQPTLAGFTRLLGSEFHFTDVSGGALKARLVACDDGPQHAGLTQFSVVFEGATLEEGLYELRHPETGPMMIGCVSSDGAIAGMSRQRVYFSSFSE